MNRECDVKMSQSVSRQRNSSSRERELDRKRREWMIEQERAREHERRKQKMIREYEERRAREIGLRNRNRRSSNRSHSRSRSHSPSTSYTKNTKTDSRVTKNLVMSEKLDSSSSNSRLFKGPEGTKIPVSELKKIKVDIRRDIDATEKTIELQRNIVNPEDIVLKRREGEGVKPIFEREELKNSDKTSANEVKERRTIVAIGTATSSRRRTISLSPQRRHRNRNPRRDSRYEMHSRSLGDGNNYRKTSEYRNRSKEFKDRYMSEHRSPDQANREYKRRRSISEERNDRYRSRKESSTYEHKRRDDRSRRYEDDRVRNRRIDFPPHYLEPMPVPFYYGNYARPVMINPMIAMRGSIGMGRGRMPPMMGLVRPSYPPRFMPPVMFRPPGPRF